MNLLKKIYIFTLIIFISLTTITINKLNTNKIIQTNLELKEITNINTIKIYLLSHNDYLVEEEIFISKEKTEDIALEIINYLKNTSINNLKGYIPNNIKINSLYKKDNTIYIDLSKEILEVANIDLILTGLTYSLTNIKEIDNIYLTVNKNPVKNYNYKLDKSIGINKEFIFTKRNNINKIVIYYIEKINNKKYFLPVTKYMNDDREKIEIIIDELKYHIPTNLISSFDENTKLIDYSNDNNVIVLNFNNKLNRENKRLVFNSIFENYNVSAVIFQENGEKNDYITRK